MSDNAIVKISVPQGSITKDQEIGVINLFIQALPEDSYLAAIFKTMAGYCEEQIRNDWAINPLDTIQHNYETIKDLELKLEAQEKAASDRMKEQANRYELAMKVQNKQDETINELEKRYNKLKDEAGALAIRNLDLEKTVENLEQEARYDHDLLIKLKAEIYDYMVAERAKAKQ